MLQVTENEIKTRLIFDNPWWTAGSIGPIFRIWPRRAYFDGFVKLVQQASPERAVILMGPRRIGKTVMLTQAIQSLVEGGTNPRDILYVSVDAPAYTGLSLERLLKLFLELRGPDQPARLYAIFDEIQYHPDWERHLKSLVDSYPGVKFVASGSAAAALKMRSLESGAGRFTEFLLPPLSFPEFLRFQKREEVLFDLTTKVPQPRDIAGLNAALLDYVNFGGFPEAVLDETVRDRMDRYIANDIVDKVLLRDLPSLYGINDTQELKRLFTVIAYNTGAEVSYEKLAQASGVAKNTLRKYLEYLEAAFLIHRLHRIDWNAKRFKRVTHFKVYLTNPSIRSALFGPISADSSAMGLVAETAQISQVAQSRFVNDISYARWKNKEVDFVYLDRGSQKPRLAQEIKWSDRIADHAHEELRSLIEFCRENKIPRAEVSTKSFFKTIEINGVSVHFSPLCLHIYHGARIAVDNQLGVSLHPKSGLQLEEAAVAWFHPTASGG